MSNVHPIRRPIDWAKLRPDDVERIVRTRAAPSNTGNVIFTDHTWDRVDERDIPRETVFVILRTGYCKEGPKRNEKGHWQVTMTKRIAGHREAGAVTIVYEEEEKLVIRTVEWMDLQ